MCFRNASSNHVKLLIAAIILVWVWLLYVAFDGTQYHLLSSGLRISGKSSHIDFLPLAEAREFCRVRRWPVYPYRHARRKIYDLLLVNTELEWLEIRMGQMNDQVDYFVVVEASKTFTDTEKPLLVRENWQRFKRYHHKIILHTLDIDGVEFENAWARERFSRNAMYGQVIPRLTGEREAFQGDVIIVSDIDEIPRPDALKALRNCEFPREVTLRTKMYYYGFQWLERGDWLHPQATYYDMERTVLPDDLRRSNGAHLYHAGWHCSYCFSTVEEMVVKIKSFSHQELDRDEFKDKEQILNRVRNGTDLFGRDDVRFDRVEDNPDVPEFILNQKDRYNYLIDRDPPNANFRDYTVRE